MDAKPVRKSKFRLAIMVIAGFALGYQVVIYSLTAYLAKDHAQFALRLDPGNSAALATIARKQLAILMADTSKDTLAAESRGLADFAGGLVKATNPPPYDASGPASSAANQTASAGVAPAVDADVASAALAPGTVTADAPDANKVAAENEQSAPDPLKLQEQLQKILVRDPLNASAWSMLGLLAAKNNETDKANRYMQAAIARSLRERPAAYWGMRTSNDAQDHAKAAMLADALLRSDRQAMTVVGPFLGQMAENDKAKSWVDKTLAANPPWRARFFASLGDKVTDARTPLNLLLALNGTQQPPADREIKDYLRLLVSKRYYALAYYTWLQFLPPERLTKVGLLYNGGFEFELSGMPFDWVVNSSTGVTFDFAPHGGNQNGNALRVELSGGRVDFKPVSQYITLAPGDYKFTGNYKGELKGRRGLKWRMICYGSTGGRNVGESELMQGPKSDWTEFNFVFSVPSQDCPALWLGLQLDARSASEKIASGTMWYDDLRIARQDAVSVEAKQP